MDYIAHIDTGTKYSEDSPKSTTLELTSGFLMGGFVYFPSGPAGLLHCIVRRGLHQILPANEGANYAIDDAVVPLHLNYMLDTRPYELEVLTWNDSETYSHTLTICVFLDPYIKEIIKKKEGSLLSRILGMRR